MIMFSNRSRRGARSVGPADLHAPKMLRNGQIAGLVKLNRGFQAGTERQVWADRDRPTRIDQISTASAIASASSSRTPR
jgi:hypothetical protein